MSCTLITTFNIRTEFLSSFWEIKKKATMIEDQRNIKKFPKVMNLILKEVENAGVSYSRACALYPNAVWPPIRGCVSAILTLWAVGGTSMWPPGKTGGDFVLVGVWELDPVAFWALLLQCVGENSIFIIPLSSPGEGGACNWDASFGLTFKPLSTLL